VKLIHVIEAILKSQDPAIKRVSEKEFIEIMELCLGYLEKTKSIKKVYEIIKREYDLEFPPKENKE